MISARDLASRLSDLLHREHAAMADFLLALADFDRRKLWRDLGHSSLFYFLHRELGLSKGAAFYRKIAAELVQRFPEIVEPLRDGRLCITSLVQLAKVLTPENSQEVLPTFFHRSKREAMTVAAALQPAQAAPHRDVVTKVRAPCAPPELSRHETAALPVVTAQVEPAPTVEPAAPVHLDEPRASGTPAPALALDPTLPRPAQRDSVEPLTAELSRLHVTVSRRFLEKLEAARAALSHSRSGASGGEILETGLDLVLEQHAKRKGLVEKPRKNPPAAKSDHVPAHVKRAVWIRDGGCCQWPLESGGICGSTLGVELDHITPRALGGPSTVENTRLLCKFHNNLAARRIFGDAWMDQFTGKAGVKSRARGSPSATTS